MNEECLGFKGHNMISCQLFNANQKQITFLGETSKFRHSDIF